MDTNGVTPVINDTKELTQTAEDITEHKNDAGDVPRVDNWAREQNAKDMKEAGGRSMLECYVQDQYFVPKSSEHVVRPPQVQASKEDKKDKQGQKTKRPVLKISLSARLCNNLVDVAPGAPVPECKFPNCKMLHDLPAYLAAKPEDLGPECYVFTTQGYCPRGLACRYSTSHVDKEGRNIRDESKFVKEEQVSNQLEKDVQIKLRKKEYDFKVADDACQDSWDIINKEGKWKEKTLENGDSNAVKTECDEPPEKKIKRDGEEKAIGPVSDEDIIKVRKGEKKVLDWTDKTYLAPLTTVGNLPFRRVCKNLGADITCGEMALALPLLQGHGPEWALLKKHKSEDFFGVQVCGCSPPQMARVAQLLEDRIECDFIDINMGCPIDLIYKKGMGSGLMARKRPMENIVRTMSSLLSKPLTMKMRTGIYSDKSIAHDIFPLVEEWGAAALTIHGRSREQRYTRLADWEYIGHCTEKVKVPVFGNGDIMNYEDYNMQKEKSKVTGVMLARGALIKPWLFTEIKEQRHWDISGQERLDIVKDFCNYGLEHWGSDDKGVENTRKFLLEWLSFAHRYVPHGILLFPPQRINERLPIYRARTEIETLLSSPDSQDWVRISEMFLGKVRDDFQFVAKHKANSYT